MFGIISLCHDDLASDMNGSFSEEEEEEEEEEGVTTEYRTR